MSRPPNYEFQEWWNKQQRQYYNGNANKLFTSSENPRLLTVEIASPNSDRTVEKESSRSARQLSWIYLLKFQQIANSIAFLTNGFVSILRTANRRVAASNTTPHRTPSKLYRIIKAFFIVVVALLVLELIAYFRGWHFSPPTVVDAAEVVDLVEYLYAKWLEIRANYLAPPLQGLTNLCIVLFLVQSVYRVVLVLGCAWIKFRGLKPVAKMEYSSSAVENAGAANAEDYPMVLVQIPMCNEREVRRCRFSKSLVQIYLNSR